MSSNNWQNLAMYEESSFPGNIQRSDNEPLLVELTRKLSLVLSSGSGSGGGFQVVRISGR